MRQIEFRGKRVDNGGWVYGSLIIEYDGSCFIVYWESQLLEPENDYSEMVQVSHEVDPSTVGQFTGLTDKNGTKIFEGDILTNNSQDDIIAEFYKGCFINSNTYIILHTEIKDPISRQISFEITGNIHDNPTP